MGNYKIEALWDCSYCGTKGIKGREQACTNCGHGRDQDVKFYLPEIIDESAAVDESKVHISDGPDWLCSYCDTYNHSDANFCMNCGASKEESEKNYFEVQRRK